MDSVTPAPLRISTITAIYALPVETINLEWIIRFFEPSEEIFSIKWAADAERRMPGAFFERIKRPRQPRADTVPKKKPRSAKTSFHNQLTFEINSGVKYNDTPKAIRKRDINRQNVYLSDWNVVNAMLFFSGKIKMAGCRNVEAAAAVVRIIAQMLQRISHVAKISLSHTLGLNHDLESGLVYSSAPSVYRLGYINTPGSWISPKRTVNMNRLFLYYNKSLHGDERAAHFAKGETLVTVCDKYFIDEFYSPELVKYVYCRESGRILGRKWIEITTETFKDKHFSNKPSNFVASSVVHPNHFLYFSQTFESPELYKKVVKNTRFSIGVNFLTQRQLDELIAQCNAEKRTVTQRDQILHANRKNCSEIVEGFFAGEILLPVYNGREKVGEEHIELFASNEPVHKKKSVNWIIERRSALESPLDTHNIAQFVQLPPDEIARGVKICMINTDFSCGFCFSSDKFIDILRNKHGITVMYNPSEYAGIILWLYLNESGTCECKRPVCKCKATVTGFPTSGSFLITGVKSFDDLHIAKTLITQFLEQYKSIIKTDLEPKPKKTRLFKPLKNN